MMIGIVCGISNGGVEDVKGERAVAGLVFILFVEVGGGNIDAGKVLERGKEGGGHDAAEPRRQIVHLAATILHLEFPDDAYSEDDPATKVGRLPRKRTSGCCVFIRLVLEKNGAPEDEDENEDDGSCFMEKILLISFFAHNIIDN
ncbi:hypothetical protein SAY87_021034 [Trapa incisa]|uniref:Uncharacterized protein n=1 Tax=Trapa incisa TaxID=236973 RepID=A0AAN7PQE2_9MYRT|nr:hypothetical protein SAY87_021034 [Trapa incisa]